MRGEMVKRIFCIVLLMFGLIGRMFPQDKTYLGLKGGINIPRLYYTNPELKSLPHDLTVQPSLGLFVEIPLTDKLALAAELNYQNRGGSTSYDYEQDYKVTYSLNATHLSLRLPLYCYFSPSAKLTPYLMIGPDLGYVIGGEISLTQPGLEIAQSNVTINNNNYNPYYIGVLAGVGLRHKAVLEKYICITKLDVALNWGLLDTFGQAEKDETAIPTNIHAYNHQGERLSRGLEISISFGLIRHEDMSACRGFE